MDGTFIDTDGTVLHLPTCDANYAKYEGQPDTPVCDGAICTNPNGTSYRDPQAAATRPGIGPAGVRGCASAQCTCDDATGCYYDDGSPAPNADIIADRPLHANTREEACEWGYIPADEC